MAVAAAEAEIFVIRDNRPAHQGRPLVDTQGITSLCASESPVVVTPSWRLVLQENDPK
jgi:hypothetical protein